MHIHVPGLTSAFVWWPCVLVRYGGFVLLIFFGMNVLISFALAAYFHCTHSNIPSLGYYEAWKGAKQEAFVSYGLALVVGLLSWKMLLLHNPRERSPSVSSETNNTHYPEQSRPQHTAVESRSAIRVEQLPPHVEQSLFTFRFENSFSRERPGLDGHHTSFNLGWTAERNDMAQPGPSATPCPVNAHYRPLGNRRKRQLLHWRRRTGDLSAIESFPLPQAETDQQRYRMTEPFPLLPVETDHRRYYATVRDEQDEGEASSSLPVHPILMNSVVATNTLSPITQGTEPVSVIVETSTPPENLREPLRTPPKINLDFNATLFSHDFHNAAHSQATFVPVEQGIVRREEPLLSVSYRSPYMEDRPSVIVRHQPRSPAISSSLGVSRSRASAALFHQSPTPEPAEDLPALPVAEFGFLLNYDGPGR